MSKSFEEIKELIIQFREERDWKQFHRIKDLLLGLNIEVAELQELFLWKSDNEIQQIKKAEIENEIADIFIFLTYICDEFDIDLKTAINKKIELNKKKYPVEKSKGSNKKYNELKS
ncbi:nucleotide pyrophosphohydrolase [Aureisphaera sp. CAU 1614]|uniref:Nucleotide pyrophosphohydrolase n=1 Tax=Halomarinibacterium sedimenti TaxID=2857106 RepID=A0A9X1FPA3_9FLAO|nr:nucleotide pyrophosphohydrolase [Halomarinibacterium sedimenti]MBW2938106.1 nucleotide pyrophosphohydrolase [Halomarinibacterium sedimenti]